MLQCIIDNMSVHGRWPLMTGAGQGRCHCSLFGHQMTVLSNMVIQQIIKYEVVAYQSICQCFVC